MVITGLTRNFTADWSFRPPEILDFKGFSKSKIEYFFLFSPVVLSKSFLNEKNYSLEDTRRVVREVEGASLEMMCSLKEPRVRIPNSPPQSL